MDLATTHRRSQSKDSPIVHFGRVELDAVIVHDSPEQRHSEYLESFFSPMKSGKISWNPSRSDSRLGQCVFMKDVVCQGKASRLESSAFSREETIFSSGIPAQANL